MKIIERKEPVTAQLIGVKHTCRNCGSTVEFDKQGDLNHGVDDSLWYRCPVCEQTNTIYPAQIYRMKASKETLVQGGGK